MAYVPHRLVIKPTMACTAACPTCALRLDLYRKLKYDKPLSPVQWEQLIEDARDLGCSDLHISGGEPTLYGGLTSLINAGKRCEMNINVNTNGSVVSAGLAENLVKAGLDSVTVSIYSWQAAVHDQARQKQGLFHRAVQAVQHFKNQAEILVDLQTILANYNILEFDRFIEMAYRLQVGNIYVSYVEGDTMGRWLPDETQIEHFRRVIIPKIEAIIDKNAKNTLKEEALTRVKKIFGSSSHRWNRFTSGIYFPEGNPSCSRPYNFALVLENGEVHPCNGVEYHHEPVMGNLHENRFPDIWNNSTWNRFRTHRQDWCCRCPMTLHFRIPIMGNPA